MTKKKSAATRDRLLQSALKIFEDKGYEACTMRELAKTAGVALGSTYYYFKSKEDLVMAFYWDLLLAAEAEAPKILAGSKTLVVFFTSFMQFRFEQLAVHRPHLGALLKNVVDPQSRLSAFSSETNELRWRTMAIFSKALDQKPIACPPSLKPFLPQLIWLFHMGLLFFWMHDGSAKQQRTQTVMNASLSLIVRMLKLMSLPGLRNSTKPLLEILRSM